jgi:hypothetical protein
MVAIEDCQACTWKGNECVSQASHLRLTLVHVIHLNQFSNRLPTNLSTWPILQTLRLSKESPITSYRSATVSD